MSIEMTKAVERKQVHVANQYSLEYYGNLIWLFPLFVLASFIIIISEKIRDALIFIGWISVLIIRGFLGIVEEDEDVEQW